MPSGQVLQDSRPWPTRSQLRLLDGVGAVDQGIWLPWNGRKGSFEVTSVGSMVGTVDLLTSNAFDPPGNGYTVTVGGSITPGDVATITLSHNLIPNGQIVASYTVLGGDTTTTIATGLVAALKAATAGGRHIDYGSVDENFVSRFNISSNNAIISIYSASSYSDLDQTPPLRARVSVSASATVSLALAQYDSGAGFVVPSCSVTAVGCVDFDRAAVWIKARCSAWTGGVLTAIVAGVP